MEAFRELAAMKRLEWSEMRRNIRDLLELYDAPTLAELLERHPPKSGVIELLGYLQIARDDGYLVNSKARQTVVIPWGCDGLREDKDADAVIEVALPLVTFVRSGRSNNGR